MSDDAICMVSFMSMITITVITPYITRIFYKSYLTEERVREIIQEENQNLTEDEIRKIIHEEFKKNIKRN